MVKLEHIPPLNRVEVKVASTKIDVTLISSLLRFKLVQQIQHNVVAIPGNRLIRGRWKIGCAKV